MTASEVIQLLADGKVLDDESGRQFYFDGISVRVKDGDDDWLPANLSTAYILTRPYVFREVE